MMELKVVYRALRQISDWTLAGFFSDVHIEGQENVPASGPLIIAASHHNEIIDIATLAVTIPHRRHLSFWAKSTMFKNPVARSILLSSGSIPVRRNPNGGTGAKGTSPSTSQESLFRETSAALAEGRVVGVFPEGTSYTEPGLAQLREGAAWAAVDYLRWTRHHEGKLQCREGLTIVPTAIVYTDKSQYQSRVCVKYGKPIPIDPYAEELFAAQDDEATSRKIVQHIMAEVDRQLLQMTINAPDWDTLYASRIARDIFWEEEVKLNQFVQISQTLVARLASGHSEALLRLKAALNEYYALIYYTGISHASLASLYPVKKPSHPMTLRTAPDSRTQPLPTRSRAFVVLATQLVLTVFHPRALLFLPPFVLHIPAYILGPLASRVFGTPGEEEGPAQFKSIFGGLGMGLSYASVQWALFRWLVRYNKGQASFPLGNLLSAPLNHHCVEFLKNIGASLAGGQHGWASVLRRALATAGLVYGTAWLLFRWHNALVKANYDQLKRLSSSYKIFRGLASSRSSDISGQALLPYLQAPRPPPNPFIKQRRVDPLLQTGTEEEQLSLPANRHVPPPDVGYHGLIRKLLVARLEATTQLEDFFGSGVDVERS